MLSKLRALIDYLKAVSEGEKLQPAVALPESGPKRAPSGGAWEDRVDWIDIVTLADLDPVAAHGCL